MPESVLQQMFDSRQSIGYGGCFYGVYGAQVVDIKDPDGQGRVRIKLPWSPDTGDSEYQAWARVATLMAGNNRGTWFVPDVGDEVLVAFNAGDTRHPYVLGALWNGKDEPPESMDGSGNNNVKTIQSRNGVRISLDDEKGQESLTLETPGGQKFQLKDGPGVVEIADSNGNSVKLEANGITVNASAKVSVSASVVDVSASAVNVNAGMTKFSGVVKADSIITNSIISASYTPGAGNIW